MLRHESYSYARFVKDDVSLGIVAPIVNLLSQRDVNAPAFTAFFLLDAQTVQSSPRGDGVLFELRTTP